MPKRKTPASADPKPFQIDGATPSRKRVNGKQVSTVTFKGPVPEEGTSITFTTGDNLTYTGTVKDAVDVDGLTVCELSDGPTPVAPK